MFDRNDSHSGNGLASAAAASTTTAAPILLPAGTALSALSTTAAALTLSLTVCAAFCLLIRLTPTTTTPHKCRCDKYNSTQPFKRNFHYRFLTFVLAPG